MTGLGKALLSALPTRASTGSWPEPYPRRTANSITDRASLREERPIEEARLRARPRGVRARAALRRDPRRSAPARPRRDQCLRARSDYPAAAIPAFVELLGRAAAALREAFGRRPRPLAAARGPLTGGHRLGSRWNAT